MPYNSFEDNRKCLVAAYNSVFCGVQFRESDNGDFLGNVCPSSFGRTGGVVTQQAFIACWQWCRQQRRVIRFWCNRWNKCCTVLRARPNLSTLHLSFLMRYIWVFRYLIIHDAVLDTNSLIAWQRHIFILHIAGTP